MEEIGLEVQKNGYGFSVDRAQTTLGFEFVWAAKQ